MIETTTPTGTPECSEHLKEQARFKIETRLSIAAQMLNDALKEGPSGIEHAAVRIAEAELLEGTSMGHHSECGIIENSAEMIVTKAKKLERKLMQAFPLCHGNLPAHLNTHLMPFDQLVAFYRQEIFWTTKGIEPMRRGEDLILEIQSLYKTARWLIDCIDHETECGFGVKRNDVPVIPPNPFLEKTA